MPRPIRACWPSLRSQICTKAFAKSLSGRRPRPGRMAVQPKGAAGFISTTSTASTSPGRAPRTCTGPVRGWPAEGAARRRVRRRRARREVSVRRVAGVEGDGVARGRWSGAARAVVPLVVDETAVEVVRGRHAGDGTRRRRQRRVLSTDAAPEPRRTRATRATRTVSENSIPPDTYAGRARPRSPS